MTDKELKRLRWLPGEVKRLEEKLTEARERYTNSLSHSVVLGSQHGEPYSVHPIVVAGPSGSKSLEAKQTVEKVERELADCQEELRRLNSFIDSIQDKQIRRIFDLYYREGLTWQAVSMKFGHPSNFWARNEAKKYFEHIENIEFGVL